VLAYDPIADNMYAVEERFPANDEKHFPGTTRRVNGSTTSGCPAPLSRACWVPCLPNRPRNWSRWATCWSSLPLWASR